ncbi:MAG: putative lipoprotein, partial [Chthonomonadales bacterium]|nr:putative lipoprotein [Chthonomonadales bacterium]
MKAFLRVVGMLLLMAVGEMMAQGQAESSRESAVQTHSSLTASETAGGWQKLSTNPVLGGNLGTCFDAAVLKENGRFRMWFSWRPQKSIAYTESKDGIHWEQPVIALAPVAGSDWEDDVNRPVVVHRGRQVEMWYTGQAQGHSAIGYATSLDGVKFERKERQPVLKSDVAWEKGAAMCPHVLWDGKKHEYQMWYSAGDQYEPDSIGYAVSRDGIHWTKNAANPIFAPDKSHLWESHKVTACHVMREGKGYLMFYIGFQNENLAQIGLARSEDGLHWERFGSNPIIQRGRNADSW